MAKTTGMTITVTEDERAFINLAAEKTGLSRKAMILYAIKKLIEDK